MNRLPVTRRVLKVCGSWAQVRDALREDFATAGTGVRVWWAADTLQHPDGALVLYRAINTHEDALNIGGMNFHEVEFLNDPPATVRAFVNSRIRAPNYFETR